MCGTPCPGHSYIRHFPRKARLGARSREILTSRFFAAPVRRRWTDTPQPMVRTAIVTEGRA